MKIKMIALVGLLSLTVHCVQAQSRNQAPAEGEVADQIEVIAIEHASAPELALVANQLGVRAKVVHDARTNSIIVTGSDAALTDLKSIVAILDSPVKDMAPDAPASVSVPVSHMPARKLIDAIRPIFPQVRSVGLDDLKTIVLQGPTKDLATAEALIRNLDRTSRTSARIEFYFVKSVAETGDHTVPASISKQLLGISQRDDMRFDLLARLDIAVGDQSSFQQTAQVNTDDQTWVELSVNGLPRFSQGGEALALRLSVNASEAHYGANVESGNQRGRMVDRSSLIGIETETQLKGNGATLIGASPISARTGETVYLLARVAGAD